MGFSKENQTEIDANHVSRVAELAEIGSDRLKPRARITAIRNSKSVVLVKADSWTTAIASCKGGSTAQIKISLGKDREFLTQNAVLLLKRLATACISARRVGNYRMASLPSASSIRWHNVRARRQVKGCAWSSLERWGMEKYQKLKQDMRGTSTVSCVAGG